MVRANAEMKISYFKFIFIGVAEHNIPALEPLIMKDFFSEDVAGMKITVFNVSAWGCTDFFVRKLE